MTLRFPLHFRVSPFFLLKVDPNLVELAKEIEEEGVTNGNTIGDGADDEGSE